LAGESNLKILLQALAPVLIEGDFVFCSIKNSRYGDFAGARPIASFCEQEGLTLVLTEQAAREYGLAYDGLFRCISLGVHSSLQAVGLTAAVAGMLTEHGISANIIAGYYHDHIFVQPEFADFAIGILSGPGK